MRDIDLPDSNIVSLLVAFNSIGRRLFGREWNNTEADAIRLGQRSKVEPEARQRGLAALKLLDRLAEDGTVNLIYTDGSNRRVPYFQNAGYPITAIFPDPVGTGEGMVQLNHEDICYCVADVRGLNQWRVKRRKSAATGPKRKFGKFEAACTEFFRTCSARNNEPVWQFAKAQLLRDDPWPRDSWGNTLINQAREKQAEADRSRIPA
jgi:hypothetical protein